MSSLERKSLEGQGFNDIIGGRAELAQEAPQWNSAGAIKMRKCGSDVGILTVSLTAMDKTKPCFRGMTTYVTVMLTRSASE